MNIAKTLVSTVCVLVAFIGCGDSGSTAPTEMATGDAGFLVVAIPPPNATPFGGPAFPWAANFTVNLLEQGGFAVDVMEISVELTPPVVYNETAITVAARTNRVSAMGTLSVPLSIAFEDAAIDARVVVRSTDERGTAIESIGRLVVIPAQRP